MKFSNRHWFLSKSPLKRAAQPRSLWIFRIKTLKPILMAQSKKKLQDTRWMVIWQKARKICWGIRSLFNRVDMHARKLVKCNAENCSLSFFVSNQLINFPIVLNWDFYTITRHTRSAAVIAISALVSKSIVCVRELAIKNDFSISRVAENLQALSGRVEKEKLWNFVFTAAISLSSAETPFETIIHKFFNRWFHNTHNAFLTQ